MTEIVLGKYLGILLFLLVLLLLIALMPLSLLAGARLDFGLLAASFLGLALLLAGFAAVGLFMSTLTQYTTVAAICTFGALLLFWILISRARDSPAATGSRISRFSIITSRFSTGFSTARTRSTTCCSSPPSSYSASTAWMPTGWVAD
jgi:hypothetical protein